MKRKSSILRSNGILKKIRNSLIVILVSTFILLECPISVGAIYIPYNEQVRIRGLVISHMRNMKNVAWTASKEFTTSSYTYTQGRAYKGIPYCLNYNTTYSTFLTYINANGYMGTTCGVDCSTAALYAWKNAAALLGMSDTTLVKYYTKTMVEEATKNLSSDKIKMAGSYTSTSMSYTVSFTTNKSMSDYKTMLSKLKPGDIVLYNTLADNKNKGHAVVFISFETDGTGINYIDIGQGSLVYPKNSMWAESTMSYEYMQKKGYIPITNSYFKSFSTY